MNLSVTHIITLILAIAITMVPGIIAARKVKSADDYALGGRSSGVALVAATIVGTLVGGGSTMGTAQLAFRMGATAWWFTLGGGIALFVLGAFYAKPLRQSGLTTISQFLVTNFGEKAGYLASISASAGMFFSVVTSTLSVTHLFCLLFNVQPWVAGIIIFFVVGGFVFYGGLKGSGIVGMAKIAFILASIFVGGCISYSALGGWSGLHSTFPTTPWFDLFSQGTAKGWMTLISLIVGVVSTQSYAQSIFSAANTRVAAVACFVAGAITIPVGVPSILIGMFMRVHHPDILPIEALPLFLATYLPQWLGGLGLAALILATVGTIVGLTLGIGTMFSRDIVKNIKKDISGDGMLWATRFGVMGACLLAIVFTNFNLDSNALDWSYLSMALRGSGIFLPLTFCVFFPKRVKPIYGLMSMGAGIFVGLTWKYIGISGVHPLIPALMLNAIFLIVGMVQNEND